MKVIKKLLKNKSIKTVIVILIIILIIGLIILSVNNDSSYIKLKYESIYLEYGNTISLNTLDYVDDTTKKFVIDEILLTTNASNETVISISEDGNEILEEHDYPAVGEYTVTLTYKNEKATVSVNVIDTTAPKFEDIAESYETTSENKLKSTDFTVYDLSGAEITIDDSDVDYDVAGTYKANIKATDPYNNTNEIQITVINEVETIADDETSISNDSSNETVADSSSTANSQSSSSTITSSTTSSKSTATNSSTSSSTSNSESTKSNNTSNEASSTTSGSTTSSSSSKNTSSSSSSNSTSSSTTNSSANSSTSSTESWAMSESEMMAYAKSYIQSIGFSWEDSFTKSNSGWNAPFYLKISMSETQIKSEIKECIDITARDCDASQGGLKFYIEKESEKLYDIYVFY